MYYIFWKAQERKHKDNQGKSKHIFSSSNQSERGRMVAGVRALAEAEG